MEEDFTEESSDGTLVRGDDHSYDAHKFPVQRGHSNTLDTLDTAEVHTYDQAQVGAGRKVLYQTYIQELKINRLLFAFDNVKFEN